MLDFIPFYFSQKSSILLIFFLNLSILSFLIGVKWRTNNDRSALWLCALTVLCLLYISLFMLGYAGWYTNDITANILFYLPLQQLFLIGPVIYYYVLTLLNPSRGMASKDVYHFVPGIIYNIFILIVFMNDMVIESDYYFYEDGMDMDLDPWYQWAGLFHMTSYLVVSLLHYNRYKKHTLNTLSFADELLYNWAQRFLFVFIVVLLLRVLFFVLNPEWGEFGSKYWYYLCFSILTLYLSFSGYVHIVQVESGLKALRFNPISESLDISESIGDDFSENEKEESADEETSTYRDLYKSLVSVIEEEKLFLNPRLSVRDFTGVLSVHEKEISIAINSEAGMNFNDWVNKYRVDEVILRFEQGEGITHTVLGIAMDCGFNSKSTFNRAFKKKTGKTPLEYLKETNE